MYGRLKSEIETLKKERRRRQETSVQTDSASAPAPESSKENLEESTYMPEEQTETQESKRYKLLIIEDHKEIRLYLKLVFSKEYDLLMAENGEEGLQTAQKELPDLIITDVMMPVMNGFECCKQLKENLDTCHIPVILLTALTDDENMMRGIELGADDYMLKPFKPEILKTKVKRLIKSREELKEIYTRLLSPSTDDPEEEEMQEAEIKSVENPFVAQVVELITANMHNPDFNVKRLAELMETSQATLYRRVKTTTDYPISEFIRSIRMKRAAKLLRSRRYSVQEVGEMVGYNDLATFRKHFADFHGTNPSAFK